MTRRILPSHPDYPQIEWYLHLLNVGVNYRCWYDAQGMQEPERARFVADCEAELAKLLEGGAFRDWVDAD